MIKINKDIKIKRVPLYWNYIPFLATKMASSIYPNIYLPDKEYNDWNSPHPSILTQSIIVHESTHLKNWKEIGVLKFAFLYLFSKSFRLKAELVPIKAQMVFLKEHNQIYDIERKARHFSGKEYFCLLSKHQSREVLTKLWENIK